MTDIKELALKTLGAMAEDGFHVYIITYEAGNERFELDEPALAEYNKRLIAAYLAEQEPVGYFHKHQYGDNCVVIENVVASAKDEEGVFPLFTALPEPAPQQQKPQTTIGDSADPAQPAAARAAPSSEEVREMVERLRNDEVDLFRLQEQAADMIERLAARVPTAGEVKA
jgi:hypothetical protein